MPLLYNKSFGGALIWSQGKKKNLFEEGTFKLRLKRQEGYSQTTVWGETIPPKGQAENPELKWIGIFVELKRRPMWLEFPEQG